MKRFVLLFLFFLPIIMLGQNLDCCKSVNEFGTYLNGFWKNINSDSNQQLRFEFKNGSGKFWRYKFDDNNELQEIEAIDQTIEIFETTSGFEIDWSNGNRLGTSKIKIIDATNLIFMRRDGKETEYHRVSE